MDKINSEVLKRTPVSLWKNTCSGLDFEWFNLIANKDTHRFIMFDIVEFHPSITPQLLDKALDYAANCTNITAEARDIIHHTKASLLLSDGCAWTKKSGFFDVAMGSYDGAECCELIAIHATHH